MEVDRVPGLPTSQTNPAAAWPRLVRFCARFTGDYDLAEDLAQETLIAAWRNGHTLRDLALYDRWLLGIARNLCRRWQQQSRRRGNNRPLEGADPGRCGDEQRAIATADGELERELERDDLATLLDRALAALPADTRAALIAHHLEEIPQAEIAARMRVSEGAVAVRLHRGRLALRRVLTTELAEEAVAYGLGIRDGVGWQDLRLWCPTCGQRR